MATLSTPKEYGGTIRSATTYDYRGYGSSLTRQGGLGVYSATQSLTSPAASSLDKPAGTLSAKTTAQIAQTGVAAQRLITSIPRTTSETYPVAARSYDYTSGLFRSDVLLTAESELISKFVSQATPEQKISLMEAAQQSMSQGQQRAMLEVIKGSEGETAGSATSGMSPLLLIAGLFLFSEVIK